MLFHPLSIKPGCGLKSLSCRRAPRVSSQCLHSRSLSHHATGSKQDLAQSVRSAKESPSSSMYRAETASACPEISASTKHNRRLPTLSISRLSELCICVRPERNCRQLLQ